MSLDPAAAQPDHIKDASVLNSSALEGMELFDKTFKNKVSDTLLARTGVVT
jgi:hypothetical protein